MKFNCDWEQAEVDEWNNTYENPGRDILADIYQEYDWVLYKDESHITQIEGLLRDIANYDTIYGEIILKTYLSRLACVRLNLEREVII
jgi:hypothetical protein